MKKLSHRHCFTFTNHIQELLSLYNATSFDTFHNVLFSIKSHFQFYPVRCSTRLCLSYACWVCCSPTAIPQERKRIHVESEIWSTYSRNFGEHNFRKEHVESWIFSWGGYLQNLFINCIFVTRGWIGTHIFKGLKYYLT